MHVYIIVSVHFSFVLSCLCVLYFCLVYLYDLSILISLDIYWISSNVINFIICLYNVIKDVYVYVCIFIYQQVLSTNVLCLSLSNNLSISFALIIYSSINPFNVWPGGGGGHCHWRLYQMRKKKNRRKIRGKTGTRGSQNTTVSKSRKIGEMGT